MSLTKLIVIVAVVAAAAFFVWHMGWIGEASHLNCGL
jgi:hypothetical protein